MKRSMKITAALCLLSSLHISLAMDQKEQITAEKSINPDLKAYIALIKNGPRELHPSALEYLRTMVTIEQDEPCQPSDLYPHLSDITCMIPREPRVILKQKKEPAASASLAQNTNHHARCTSVSNCYNPRDRCIAKPVMGPIQPRAEAFPRQRQEAQRNSRQSAHLIAVLAAATRACVVKSCKTVSLEKKIEHLNKELL